MTIPVVVCGALGRMGQKVIAAILARPELKLCGAVERGDHPRLGEDIGPILGAGEMGVFLKSDLAEAAREAKVYIDFTSIESGLANLKVAAKMGVGAVIGTTGFSETGQAAFKEAAKTAPILWAPNMSLGVNVMYKMAAQIAKALGDDFDIEIVESHHNQKKDAPSGTAVKLHQVLEEARGLKDSMVCGREGIVGERQKGEIGVLAIRGGDIVGEHTVYYCGPGERIELTHRAHTRDTFASGAVRAAMWLGGQKPGLYSINNVLGFNE